jgi:hypothetical protein
MVALVMVALVMVALVMVALPFIGSGKVFNYLLNGSGILRIHKPTVGTAPMSTPFNVWSNRRAYVDQLAQQLGGKHDASGTWTFDTDETAERFLSILAKYDDQSAAVKTLQENGEFDFSGLSTDALHDLEFCAELQNAPKAQTRIVEELAERGRVEDEPESPAARPSAAQLRDHYARKARTCSTDAVCAVKVGRPDIAGLLRTVARDYLAMARFAAHKVNV